MYGKCCECYHVVDFLVNSKKICVLGNVSKCFWIRGTEILFYEFKKLYHSRNLKKLHRMSDKNCISHSFTCTVCTTGE